MTTMASASIRARLFGDAETDLFAGVGVNGYRTSGPTTMRHPPERRQPAEPPQRNGGHGSKCFCCPYGYHIDLDFVRYCENWQAAASDRIARSNQEKRRIRRARQRQCQSMEFLLGLPEEKENKPAPQPSPAPKPTPPKPPPKPSPDSIKLNKEWHDTLSNFEQTLSQSYTGPSSSSACSTPICGLYLGLANGSRASSASSGSSHEHRRDSPGPHRRPAAGHQRRPSLDSEEWTGRATPLSSSRLVLRSQQQQQQQQQQRRQADHRDGGEEDGDRERAREANGFESRPCLENIREQMAAALERMKQLEEQVKEIPLLHVQMSVLREERRILLRQLAAQRRLNAGQQPSKRDVGTSCAVVTRDVGVCHRQTKCREASTSTRPSALSLCSGVEATSIAPDAPSPRPASTTTTVGTQCQVAPHEPQRASKSVQCTGAAEPSPRPSCTSTATQCAPGTPEVVVEPVGREERATQCSVETRERGTHAPAPATRYLMEAGCSAAGAAGGPTRRNKEVQATESQPWSKLKLSMGVMAKPSLSDASTETLDASIGLAALRRQQLHRAGFAKSVGTSVQAGDLVATASKATETTRPRARDFGTSPQRRQLVDASCGTALPSSSTNYCDECKQSRRGAALGLQAAGDGDGGGLDHGAQGRRGAKAAVERRNAEIGQRARLEAATAAQRTKIPVMREPKAGRKATLIRQDTWTESLDKLDGSEPLDKYADRHQPRAPPTPKDHSDNDSDGGRDATRRPAKDADGTATESPRADNGELRDDSSLDGSVIIEAPKTRRAPQELSREMRAALKVLDDNLRKVSAGGTLVSKVKNASNMVQHEWFKISSTSQADPHTVEYYLDQFEQHSGPLLGHVVNLTDSSGNTAMHYAVSHGNFDVVSILIDSKVCDVNRSNNAGYTPVMLAALAQVRNSAHASVVKRLFEMADVNVRARLHGQTALMLAVSHGRKDMSHLLLEAGAAVNLQDEDGSTALMCAAEHGHADIVRLLLAHPDCDSSILDVDGSSALKIAMEAGHADIGVLLYTHQRASRVSPMPGQFPAPLPSPRALGKRQRTTSSHHHGGGGNAHAGHHNQQQHQQQFSVLSMSAPASPVAAASRKFHSSSLSLVDSPKYSL